jgi:hypothetical protein
MATEQRLLRLPKSLVRRFKQTVPARERSAFIRQLLKQALPPTDSGNNPFYLAALAVERDTALGEEMTEWEASTIGEGLAGRSPPVARLNDVRAAPRLGRKQLWWPNLTGGLSPCATHADDNFSRPTGRSACGVAGRKH